MGGGLNHSSLLLEFTLINQNNRDTVHFRLVVRKIGKSLK